MNNPIIVGDADAIVAQANPDDVHHNKAIVISNNLKDNDAQVIYPVTAVLEAATHIQRVLNSTASAYSTAIVFADPHVQVVEVNQETLRHAISYFSSKTSKKNTLFDCVVAAIADRYKADAIFSFDRFYEKRGFKLASALK